MKKMTYLLNLTLLVVCTQFVFADGSAEAAAQVKADNYFLEKGYSSGDVQNIFTYIKLHDDTNFFGGSSISIDHDNKIFCMFNTIIPKQQRQKIIIGPWIDCFIIREYNKDFIINTHLPMFFHPKELIFPLKQITDKLGNDFWIPKEERKILSLIYDDWYIPQKMSFSQCMQKRVDVLTNNIEYNEIWKKIKEKYPDYITRQKRIGVRL